MADAPSPRSLQRSAPLPNLRGIPPGARLIELQRRGILPADGEGFLSYAPEALAEEFNRMIENAIGAYPVPLGVATNFVINGVPRLVAMATEERSVVAAASKGAKLALPDGFTVEAAGPRTRAQIMYSGLPDPPAVLRKFRERRAVIEDLLAAECNPMRRYGGGLEVLEPRFVPGRDGDTLVIVEIEMGTGEAMGANVVTRAAERAAERLLRLFSDARPTAVICSNADAGWTVRAEARFRVPGPKRALRRVLDIQSWADHDPSRAVTHNKGVMNAVSGVCLATGQDTRAIEACVHAGACASHQYRPLTSYEPAGEGLVRGTLTFTAPIGTVGGATGTRAAALCRAMMRAGSAKELACVLGAAGLAQNFAALLALSSEGIPGSHERLARQRNP